MELALSTIHFLQDNSRLFHFFVEIIQDLQDFQDYFIFSQNISFFPFAVTIRSYLHGIALRDHRTSTITLSGPARVLAIVVVVNFLMLFGFHGATCGVAALFTGFVAETIVVYWRMGKKL